MTNFKIWTTSPLTDDLHEEFNAIYHMPEGSDRTNRIQAFKDEIKASGIKATIEDCYDNWETHTGYGPYVVAEGEEAVPGDPIVYFIHFNEDYHESADLALTSREVNRRIFDAVLADYMDDEEDGAPTQSDIDENSDAFRAAVNKAYNERSWKGLTVHQLNKNTNEMTLHWG